jgi:hypothetical protein
MRLMVYVLVKCKVMCEGQLLTAWFDLAVGARYAGKGGSAAAAAQGLGAAPDSYISYIVFSSRLHASQR